ncbi:MAG: hypothetical protein ACPG77_00470 [Nannocystaceae bacterium]
MTAADSESIGIYELSGGCVAVEYSDGSINLFDHRPLPSTQASVMSLSLLQRTRLMNALAINAIDRSRLREQAKADMDEFNHSIQTGNCPRCLTAMRKVPNPRHPELGVELQCICGFKATT